MTHTETLVASGRIATANPKCKKCNVIFDTRVSRGLVIKTFLFWLPVKRYYCSKCRKVRVVMND